ncbi:MAG TPA: large-conductance mechanosensitive channel protein MscL [Xanthomonadaceae bacterium]|nr:large-conductance mechanosensitive channel protein MscL [Xanthomonadaceae bacterium]
MGMIQEFKTFALRGNVVDLAVGVVIGAAFGKIVGSLVDHVIMPPIGLLIGGVDFSDIGITLRAATEEAPAVVMQVGTFINTLIQFIIIAFAIFLVVKAINRMQRKEAAKPAPPPVPSAEEVLLTEIRDLLRAR